jgi:hypothetical protein
MLATREAIQAAGDKLAGLQVRSGRAQAERAAAITDADRDRVRAVLGDDAAAGRLVRFVISTEQRASDGHTIAAGGWMLEGYQRNPVVLWQHNRSRPRVADSVAWIEGGALRAIAAFVPREVDPFAAALGELAALRGHAASVGFDILEAAPASPDIRKETPWALDISRAALLEWSLVNIPADTGAIAEAREHGVDTAPIARELEHILDERMARLEVAVRERLEQALEAARTAAAPKVVDLAGALAPQLSAAGEKKSTAADALAGALPRIPRG